MKTFPWARAMEIGFGVLRLPPDQFWRMTLPELAAAARGAGLASASITAMTRRELSALAGRFPDRIA
ncbi:MAG: phage tail assembly chaperone [Parvibaculum sp.]|uniref:rcc01693 family protein n=1 Tax=Parvibaculum sp. TaxID=2024848 RepID=UPI002849CF43|nr:rcc01693 family protein [Parvibaculum sp.]MDR3497742.1 phage tail assembly chaperone [Parvibaculum sp.]